MPAINKQIKRFRLRETCFWIWQLILFWFGDVRRFRSRLVCCGLCSRGNIFAPCWDWPVVDGPRHCSGGKDDVVLMTSPLMVSFSHSRQPNKFRPTQILKKRSFTQNGPQRQLTPFEKYSSDSGRAVGPSTLFKPICFTIAVSISIPSGRSISGQLTQWHVLIVFIYSSELAPLQRWPSGSTRRFAVRP